MHQVLYALIISILFVGGMTAQSAPPSIFVYESSQGGTKADAAASSLEMAIFDGLFKKYPCMDVADKQGIVAVLGVQRMEELLGTAEPNEELLRELGDAVGARYVVKITATQLPNGTVYIQVLVLDTVTAKAIVRRDAPPATDQTVNSTIETLKAQALSDMANFLQGKCDEHWTGYMSYAYRYDESSTKGSGENGEWKFASSTTANDTLYVMLRAMTLGSTDPSRPKAQFTREFEYHHTSTSETRGPQRCRPPKASSYLRPSLERRSEKMDETGNIKGTLTMSIYVSETGEYQIRIVDRPDITTKWTREDFYQRPGGCEDPPPMTATSTGEDSSFAGSFKRAGAEITGKVDPKNPDILVGTKKLGDAEVGIETISWNLRRVRPKGRKEK